MVGYNDRYGLEEMCGIRNGSRKFAFAKGSSYTCTTRSGRDRRSRGTYFTREAVKSFVRDKYGWIGLKFVIM